jgi:FKBP-type peptidyl-prolyl cis-trans isomerase
MLKDQLIAFGLLLPFLAGPKTSVSMEPPTSTTTKPPVTAKQAEKKTTVPAKSTETPKTTSKNEPAKTESKKPEAQKTVPNTGPSKSGPAKTETKKAEPAQAVEQKVPAPDQLKTPIVPPYTEIAIGTGAKVAPGERAVFHFSVTDSTGKELVNSKKRGLPFAVESKTDGTEVWDTILKEMKVGGVRKMALTPEQVNAGKGLPPYVPPGVAVTVTVWLLRSEK